MLVQYVLIDTDKFGNSRVARWPQGTDLLSVWKFEIGNQRQR